MTKAAGSTSNQAAATVAAEVPAPTVLPEKSRPLTRSGNTTQHFFDHRGRVAKTKDALGNTTLRAYDDRGRLTKLTDAAGRIQTFAYDTFGNRIAETDALGNTTRYAYDGTFNKLSRIIDGNGM